MGLLDLVNLVLTSSSPNLGTLVITWASPGEGELVPIWASPSPGYFVPHLELIAVDSFFASPGTGDSDPTVRLPDLVTLVLNWDSPGLREYAPSWPHLDLVTVVPAWASSGHGSAHGLQVGLTWTW